jgi:hypothetical protein
VGPLDARAPLVRLRKGRTTVSHDVLARDIGPRLGLLTAPELVALVWSWPVDLGPAGVMALVPMNAMPAIPSFDLWMRLAA